MFKSCLFDQYKNIFKVIIMNPKNCNMKKCDTCFYYEDCNLRYALKSAPVLIGALATSIAITIIAIIIIAI